MHATCACPFIYIYAACACHFYYFLKEEEEEERRCKMFQNCLKYEEEEVQNCLKYEEEEEEEEEAEEEEERKKVQNVSKLFKICHKRGPNKAKNTRIDPKCPLLVRRLEVQFCHQ